jgi:hypothetical protein
MGKLEDQIDRALAVLAASETKRYVVKSKKPKGGGKKRSAPRTKKGIRIQGAARREAEQLFTRYHKGEALRQHEFVGAVRSFATEGRPDWVVRKVTLTARGRSSIKARGDLSLSNYPFHVVGYHFDTREPFRWELAVDGLKDPRFDLSHAVIEAAAKKFIGRTRTAKRRVGQSWYGK